MPPKLTNSVNRLDWNVPIVNANGTPTDEFMRKWSQQAQANAAVPNLNTAAAVSAVLDLLGSTRGSLLYRAATAWALLPPNAAGKVLTDSGPGADPSWQTPSSGGGGGAASAKDDGTTFYIALSDPDGQLILDSLGNPIFAPEVLPASAIPSVIKPAVMAAANFRF